MKKLILSLCFLASLQLVSAQQIIDEIVAVVGSEVILRSEVESQVDQMVQTGEVQRNEQTVCMVLEDMVIQKMLLEQARFDSLPVSEDQVESELNRRMDYFIRQFGGKDKMEEYLGKTVDQLKDDFRPSVKEQLLIQAMRGKITGKAKVTPSDVKNFFNAIPKDSLPYIPSEVQIGVITLIPPIRQEEKDRIIQELTKIREQILSGSKFSLKARIWSDDEGSKTQGGELGMMRREDLVPEFSSVAFALTDPTQVSDIVETPFGFHIIQLIEKRGEYSNFRHILMIPKVATDDIRACEIRLDSIKQVIQSGNLSFGKAAEIYSQDADTKLNGGLLVNPYNGSTKFAMDELAEIDIQTFQQVSDLNVGQFSSPNFFATHGGPKSVRILYLVSRSEPHEASMDTDYPKLQQMALAQKQNEYLYSWVNSAKSDFYIRIEPSFKTCDFKVDWEDKKSANR